MLVNPDFGQILLPLIGLVLAHDKGLFKGPKSWFDWMRIVLGNAVECEMLERSILVHVSGYSLRHIAGRWLHCLFATENFSLGQTICWLPGLICKCCGSICKKIF